MIKRSLFQVASPKISSLAGRLAIAEQNPWLSGEHSSVDGTPIGAWAGHKSFQVKRAKADNEESEDSEDGGCGSDESDGDKGHNEAQEPGNFKG
jgi:hypothetical protein